MADIFPTCFLKKTHNRGQQLSFFADFGCFVMAVPSVLIGAIAKNTSK